MCLTTSFFYFIFVSKKEKTIILQRVVIGVSPNHVGFVPLPHMVEKRRRGSKGSSGSNVSRITIVNLVPVKSSLLKRDFPFSI